MAQNRGYLATLEANPNHKMMVAMVKSNKVYSAMLASATIPMTIFAPTDSVSNAVRVFASMFADNPFLIFHNVLARPLPAASNASAPL